MSVQSEIERINNNVQSTLNTIAETGVSVGTNSDALPAAAAALANEKADVNHSHVWEEVTGKPELFSGNYNDLEDKPSIPTALSELSGDSTHRTVTDAEKSAWNAKSNFSGSYNDLTNKPSIPSAYSHPTYTAKSNGFYKVTVDGTGHVSGTAAVSKSDITGLGIPAQDTTYSVATQSAAGLMSVDDKKKLDGIASGANNYTYTHPSSHPASMITGLATVATSGSYNDLANKPTIPSAYSHPASHPASMITGLATVATSGSYNDLSNKPSIPSAYTHPTTSGNKHIPSGGSSGQILRWSADGTAAWGADNNTTYSEATTSAAGLMSASDKSKLNGIASGANAYSHPSTHSASMISSGTFTGAVAAGASSQTPANSLLRNSKIVSADTNPTTNGEINWTYK